MPKLSSQLVSRGKQSGLATPVNGTQEDADLLWEAANASDKDAEVVRNRAQWRLKQAQENYRRNPTPANKRALESAEGVATAADERFGTVSKVAAKKAAAAGPQKPDPSKDYGLAGSVTDDMYKVAPELLGPSARAGVTADKGAMDAQNKALDELFGIYSQGGATAQERARMARTRADQDQYLRSQREAQQQDLAERGMLGSGAEIAMALGDRQAAGSRMAQQDLDTEAMLQDRALGALMQGSQVAGQIRGSSFNEGMARGTAKDEFAAMNADIINSAKASNTDFLRQSKANLAQQQYDAWQRGLDRNTGIATGIMGFDQDENQTGWRSGQQTAANDSQTANDAMRDDVNDFKQVHGGFVNQDQAAEAATGDATKAAREKAAAGVGQTAEGAGQLGDAAMSGGAAGSSGSALSFGGPPDDDEEDK